MIKFSSFLKKQRQAKGLSKKDLAKQVGCTSRAIDYWEEGKRVPSIELADKALKILGVGFVIGKENLHNRK